MCVHLPVFVCVCDCVCARVGLRTCARARECEGEIVCGRACQQFPQSGMTIGLLQLPSLTRHPTIVGFTAEQRPGPLLTLCIGLVSVGYLVIPFPVARLPSESVRNPAFRGTLKGQAEVLLCLSCVTTPLRIPVHLCRCALHVMGGTKTLASPVLHNPRTHEPITSLADWLTHSLTGGGKIPLVGIMSREVMRGFMRHTRPRPNDDLKQKKRTNTPPFPPRLALVHQWQCRE